MTNITGSQTFKEIPKDLWDSWKWQMKNRIRELEELEGIVNFKEDEKLDIERACKVFPMSITPYYASLIDRDDPNCPIRRQAVTDVRELEVADYDMEDPLHEESDSPVPGLTHRYPDRVLFLLTTECSMYCRHCTRKRKVGDNEQIVNFENIKAGIEYIKENPVVRDVLLSGGDPFLLETDVLERIIKAISEIPHVEFIRIGTRTPVVLPQRITPKLVNMLKKYHPLWINTHFNHPNEITGEAEKALAMLADAGLPLGNQSVLLRGVNDCPDVMKKLVHILLKNRVRPYYIYQCDLSRGIEHFRTPISTGVEIMERLIGHTSGLAVPRYIVDAPGGGGKIPVLPNYLISCSHGKSILRNYEGIITLYNEPVNFEDPSENCPKSCNLCKQDCNTSPSPVGLEKLLNDDTEDISLIPEDNQRMERAKQNDEISGNGTNGTAGGSDKVLASQLDWKFTSLFKIKNFKKKHTHKN